MNSKRAAKQFEVKVITLIGFHSIKLVSLGKMRNWGVARILDGVMYSFFLK